MVRSFLDFARTCLKVWNRVDRGRFTNQDQKGNKIGKWFQSYQRFRGADLRGTLQKTTSFSKSSLMAQLTRAVHAEICVSQRKLSWQICYHTCVGTKRAIDASYRALDASQRSRKRRSCRWAAGNVHARRGTSAVRFVVPYA